MNQRNESVSQRVTGLMSKNSPMMQQARTQGRQEGNRRGLLNSSMSAGAAHREALKQAVPIASQEAQQASQANRQGAQLESREYISRMDIAAREREKMASLSAAYENTYSQMVSTVMNNHKMPADAREEYIKHAGRVRDSNMALLEQMYGVQLEWTTPGTPEFLPPGEAPLGSEANPRVGQVRESESGDGSLEVWNGQSWTNLQTGTDKTGGGGGGYNYRDWQRDHRDRQRDIRWGK
ncbi:hypothetical protein [Fodinicurvata sediminis]|uniref:hypothetical protein n=1 Tax=Fodinicurvata sediminis TaxID=1121832 RepID=UPI000401415A|nr:hypothetical protein [Fodinicurvata sediminis]